MNYVTINEKIKTIWKKNQTHKKTKTSLALARTPMLYPSDFISNSVLFIGLNPSYSPKEMNKVCISNGINGIKNINNLFKFSSLKDRNLEKKILNIEENARHGDKPHKYFHKFCEITKHINGSLEKIKWEHIDLLYIRETNQNNIKGIIEYKESNNTISVNKFATDQINLTMKIIDDIQPIIIVIVSALVYKILNNLDNNKFINDFDDKRGCWFYKNIPVLASGMLSGRRALDNGSFEVLIWNIKRIVEFEKH